MTIGALLPVYRELLALHVISVIVWMAGMIMLPAIYARHVATTTEVARDAGFVELERGIIQANRQPSDVCRLGLRHPAGCRSWHDFVVGRLVVDEVHRRARVVGLLRRAIPAGVVACGTAPIATRLLLCHGDARPDRIGHVDRDDGDHSALIVSRSTSRNTTALLRWASCAAKSSVTGPARHRCISSASGAELAESSAR